VAIRSSSVGRIMTNADSVKFGRQRMLTDVVFSRREQSY
jgi:hypothetical protein